jgi:hypothetical protein
MAKLTITEALQEIKTIGKRLEKKRLSVIGYLVRDSRVRDPLEKDGGAEKFVAQERQAIADLEAPVIAIRTAIQRSNLESSLTVEEKTRTVAEWLTWRREISNGQKTFLTTIANQIASVRQQVQQKGGKVVAAAVAINEAPDPLAPPQILVALDERGVIEDQEKLETVLGTLDGKLSLFNATTVIEA